MIQWLYRYVFRGIGVLFAIGMLTVLILAISSLTTRPEGNPATPAHTARLR